MSVKPNKHFGWGADANKYPFTVVCDTPKCYWLIGHPGPEDAAQAALERHMQSDACPRPLLYHGKGIEKERANS